MNQKTITWLTPEADREWFPPLDHALDEPEGLLAAGGDLSVPRLLAAYRRGIFPLVFRWPARAVVGAGPA
jgi:leucyl/phenylalanyl-tRNA---protein transferase